MTKREALSLTPGQWIHSKTLTNADGTPLRAKVNGQVKTWKTRPNDIIIPCKYGMYDYLYVGNVWSVRQVYKNKAVFSYEEWRVGYGS